jgi:hypothetical protein
MTALILLSVASVCVDEMDVHVRGQNKISLRLIFKFDFCVIKDMKRKSSWQSSGTNHNLLSGVSGITSLFPYQAADDTHHSIPIFSLIQQELSAILMLTFY